MQDRGISLERSEFLIGTRLAGSVVKIPIPRGDFPVLHGLAHNGLFFSHI